MKFKDKNGKEYTFNATAANVIRAEKRGGESLLTGLFRAAAAETEIESASALFSNTKSFCATLYECSVPLSDQADLSFEAFCDLFEYVKLFRLRGEVTEVLFSSFAPEGGTIAPADEAESDDEKKSVSAPGELETSTT